MSILSTTYFEQRDRLLPTRLLLLLCLLACWPAASSVTAWAQEPAPPNDLRIQQLRVQVLPEFDDPSVLVMVQGRLDAASDVFPITITFRLPHDAQINQMATVNMQSAGSTSMPYHSQPDPTNPRWQLVSYDLDGAHFFYEFYYDPIVGDVDKAFTFSLNSYHPVDDASVEIQQPKTAEAFSISPQPDSSRLDQNLRLYYHQIHLGTLLPDQVTSISVNYSKADPDPSLTWEQVMALQEGKRPPEAASTDTTSGFQVPTEVFVFLGGALLILFGTFVGYRLRLGEHSPDEDGVVLPDLDRPDHFCRICGTTLKTDASYCHRCGSMVLHPSANLEPATTATVATPWPNPERR